MSRPSAISTAEQVEEDYRRFVVAYTAAMRGQSPPVGEYLRAFFLAGRNTATEKGRGALRREVELARLTTSADELAMMPPSTRKRRGRPLATGAEQAAA